MNLERDRGDHILLTTRMWCITISVHVRNVFSPLYEIGGYSKGMCVCGGGGGCPGSAPAFHPNF